MFRIQFYNTQFHVPLKIEQFVNSIKNLKTEQTQVDQQLDFILSQQKDLEDCLSTLEDEVSSYFPELPADDMYVV